MKNPEHFYYTKEHEWAEFKDGKVIIGITEYAQSQLGDVIFLEFPEVGQEFSAGDVFGEVEAVKTVSELYSPISGKIIDCLLYTSPSPRDGLLSRMPSSA